MTNTSAPQRKANRRSLIVRVIRAYIRAVAALVLLTIVGAGFVIVSFTAKFVRLWDLPQSQERSECLLNAGIMVWGAVLIFIVFGILGILGYNAWHSSDDGELKDNSLRGAYAVIKDNATTLSAIIAVLGLAWSWFFQIGYK